MIRGPQDYDLVREQLARVRRALASLEREVRPRSEERFRLIAESYHNMIEKLQADLDDYDRALASEKAPAGTDAG